MEKTLNMVQQKKIANKNIFMKILTLVILTVLLTYGCAFIPKVNYIPNTNNLISRTPPSAIEVMKDAPKRAYSELGTVIADPRKSSFENAVNEMKKKASKVGGDAIFGITRTSDMQYVSVGGISATAGNMQGGSFAQTYRTNELRATIIRWKD